MTYHEGRERGELSIVEAVETLTSIADLEVEGPIAIAERHEIELQELPIIYRTVHWLHRKNAEKVMVVVRDTFRTILHYLKHFYKAEYGKLVQHESVEGIKTIMVLVGEAAKKVDKYTRVFIGANVNSVKESKEFRDLWAFYQRKIAPIAMQESLSKWIHHLPVKMIEEVILPDVGLTGAVAVPSTEHLFIDLDTVKKDSEYELFLIRKEDGSRFFNPRLLRNIKLVCNFEEYISEEGKYEPLKELITWKDMISRQIARNIVRQNWNLIDGFIKLAKKHYNDEVVSVLYRACIALMLSANQSTALKELVKGSSGYLLDFQRFLRHLLQSADFQRIITYPPKNEEAIQHKIVELVQHFCRQLYSGFHYAPDSTSMINDLILKGMHEQQVQEPNIEGNDSISNKMALDFDALHRSMSHYSHVPLLNIIEMLQDSDINGYDPLMLQNMPTCIFDLYPKGRRMSVLRIPSPTNQEYIHKAFVSEEFKSYLRSLAHDQSAKELLVFNLQDRTSLREYARCNALEELQKKDEFAKSLVVVSMTKDSDFYHQIGPYQELNHADLFMDHLHEHIQSENSGYFYPATIKKALFSGFSKKLLHAIHSLFFGKKNVLSRHNRLDFIELYYTLMQLKIIELVQPGSISFSCKDAIDVGMPASVELFLVLKLLNARPLSGEEEQYLKAILYCPSICYRGRTLFLERFSRMNNMTRLIEATMEEQGIKAFHAALNEEIAPLYEKDMMSCVVCMPQPIL